MAISRWNPWSDLFSLHDQMDQLFGETFGRTAAPDRRAGLVTSLPIDIRQTGDAFVIEASVPGLRPEEVDVTLDENVLTIRGEHSESDSGSEEGYVRRERRIASVFRQIGLPAEVKPDEITATFENGVLTVRVPRAQKAQPKRIPVDGRTSTQQKVVEAPKSS